MAKKSDETNDLENDPAPVEDDKPKSTARDAKQLAKDVADETRGKYEAELIGDSTLIIRYADGTSDSYTVDRVER